MAKKKDEVKEMIVTEEVALHLDMPPETLAQLYENLKQYSGMEPDTKLDEQAYLDMAIRTAMSHFTEQMLHRGWQAAVVFLALVCRNYDTRRVFANPATLDEIRHGLEINTRAALEKALRTVSTLS